MKEELSHTESLKIINEMISEAKNNYEQSGSFYFLLWGWVVMVANLGHYFLDKFTSFEYPFIFWLLTFPAAILAAWHGSRQKNKSQVKTHFSRLYGEVWVAIGICMVLTLLFMSKINFNHSAIILLLAGAGTYLSGRMLKFRPLIFGAFALWLAGIVCFSLPMTDQYLVGAIGILAGYLIPGYLLKSAEK
ncbi:MAG: hypothetical protein ABJH98_04120 [Reichenbachiella sp.]|uniref:hypothetical protein n=1 Tax=Reichenbachiella sp. TaxID=2184521 RepID=UPI003296A4EB